MSRLVPLSEPHPNQRWHAVVCGKDYTCIIALFADKSQAEAFIAREYGDVKRDVDNIRVETVLFG